MIKKTEVVARWKDKLRYINFMLGYTQISVRDQQGLGNAPSSDDNDTQDDTFDAGESYLTLIQVFMLVAEI